MKESTNYIPKRDRHKDRRERAERMLRKLTPLPYPPRQATMPFNISEMPTMRYEDKMHVYSRVYNLGQNHG